MTRLLVAIYWDVQLQFRNGFYYAAAVVVVLAIILLSQVPAGAAQHAQAARLIHAF